MLFKVAVHDFGEGIIHITPNFLTVIPMFPNENNAINDIVNEVNASMVDFLVLYGLTFDDNLIKTITTSTGLAFFSLHKMGMSEYFKNYEQGVAIFSRFAIQKTDWKQIGVQSDCGIIKVKIYDLNLLVTALPQQFEYTDFYESLKAFMNDVIEMPLVLVGRGIKKDCFEHLPEYEYRLRRMKMKYMRRADEKSGGVCLGNHRMEHHTSEIKYLNNKNPLICHNYLGMIDACYLYNQKNSNIYKKLFGKILGKTIYRYMFIDSYVKYGFLQIEFYCDKNKFSLTLTDFDVVFSHKNCTDGIVEKYEELFNKAHREYMTVHAGKGYANELAIYLSKEEPYVLPTTISYLTEH